MMEFPQIRAFLAVAQELHFGRAASALRMAQPQLSRVIRQFEIELGGALFVRNTRRVQLTMFGRTMLDPLRQVLSAREAAEAIARAASSGAAGMVRIGFGGISSHELMARLAILVRQERPGIELQIDGSLFGAHAVEGVARGEVDLAIVRYDRDVPELAMRVVGREPVLLAVPEGHRLATSAEVLIADLRDESFVTLPAAQGSTLAGVLAALGERAGFYPRVAQTAPDSAVAMAFVAAGIGVSLSVASVRDRTGIPGVVFRELPELPALEVRLVWRQLNSNPALESVLALVERALPAGWGAGEETLR